MSKAGEHLQVAMDCRQAWLRTVWELWLEDRHWVDPQRRREEEGCETWRGSRKLPASAERSAGMLRSITKPLPCSGGVQVIEDVSEDAKLLKRVEVKRQRWKDHQQVDVLEQNPEDRPWEK